MRNSFISVVIVLNVPHELRGLRKQLTELHPCLQSAFKDFEVVLVNNGLLDSEIDEQVLPLPAEIRHQISQLNLSATTQRNNAVVAGLDRANGDYTVLFETLFLDQPELIPKLYDETQLGSDIVYLRAKGRQDTIRSRAMVKVFYYILKNYSSLKIDERAHDTRIISRRALNSLLRLRENLRYMKAIYSLVGYKTNYLEVDTPLGSDEQLGFSERFRTSLVAITSFTTFLRSVLLWIFVGSSLFLVLVITNALKVKFTNTDLFGTYYDAIPGWTFLVVLMSIFFAITCLMLYIMSIYLSNIYNEIKQRPLYIIESIKRY